MTDNVQSAIFNNHADAHNAIRNLRIAGVSDDDISIVSHESGETVTTDGAGEETEEMAKDVVGTAAAGAGIGALLGVAALAIPGVGPFVAAGAIAQAAIGGAAITGTAIGAAAGGIAGALADHGVSTEDSKYYSTQLDNGGVLILVNTDSSSSDKMDISNILYSAGGHSSTRAHSV